MCNPSRWTSGLTPGVAFCILIHIRDRPLDRPRSSRANFTKVRQATRLAGCRTTSPPSPMSAPHRIALDACTRRQWLVALAALSASAAGLDSQAEARPVPPRADSPKVGVDPILVRSGLTDRWRAAMGRDLGWQAIWEPMDSAEVLRQLESGELPAGIFLSSARADDLDHQGLIHSRQTLGRTPVLLMGPNDDLAGIRSERDVGRALSQVLLAAQAGAVQWTPPHQGTPLASLLTRLTQGQATTVAGLRHNPNATAKGPAYELVPLALRRPQDRRKVWLQGDPRMVLEAQVACSFRNRHPGGKLLVNWLGWPVGQSAFKQSPGWLPRDAQPSGAAR